MADEVEFTFKEINFNEICRTCMLNENLKFINEVSNLSTSIEIMLMAVANIQVIRDDGLPNQICLKCINQLEAAYKFKNQCEEIQTKLNALFSIQKEYEEKNPSIPTPRPNFKPLHRVTDSNDQCESVSPSDLSPSIEKKQPDELYPISQITVSANSFQTHIHIHHRERPFKCLVCEKCFTSNNYLLRHKLRHTKEQTYKCQECNKSFLRVVSLRIHQRLHTVENPFKCSKCPKIFGSLKNFKSHMKRHSDPKYPYRKTNNTRPLKSSYKIKEFLCSVCGKGFDTKTGLCLHTRVHTGERPFPCSQCSKSFKTIHSLKTHMLTHTGERPHKCEVCEKTFTQIGSLKAHLLIHTGIRPHVCQYCTKTFQQRTHLNYHLKTHTGEKSFTCTECGKSFALKGNLTVHMRMHSGETPFICPECGKGFYSSSSMKKHCKRAHRSLTEIDSDH